MATLLDYFCESITSIDEFKFESALDTNIKIAYVKFFGSLWYVL